MTKIDVKLLVQVIADAAGDHLGDELRSPCDIILLVDPCLPSVFGLDEQQDVGLRHVLPVESDMAAVSGLDPRGERCVVPQPPREPGMRRGVLSMTGPEPEIDHPVDELRVLEVGRRIVSPLELLTGQPVAVLQRRDRPVAGRPDGPGGWVDGVVETAMGGLPGRRWLGKQSRPHLRDDGSDRQRGSESQVIADPDEPRALLRQSVWMGTGSRDRILWRGRMIRSSP